jgi:hypothetical protein
MLDLLFYTFPNSPEESRHSGLFIDHDIGVKTDGTSVDETVRHETFHSHDFHDLSRFAQRVRHDGRLLRVSRAERRPQLLRWT